MGWCTESEDFRRNDAWLSSSVLQSLKYPLMRYLRYGVMYWSLAFQCSPDRVRFRGGHIVQRNPYESHEPATALNPTHKEALPTGPLHPGQQLLPSRKRRMLRKQQIKPTAPGTRWSHSQTLKMKSCASCPALLRCFTPQFGLKLIQASPGCKTGLDGPRASWRIPRRREPPSRKPDLSPRQQRIKSFQVPQEIGVSQQRARLIPFAYRRIRRSRRAFPTTDTELKLIAAAAMTGLSSRPKNGYSTPAAIGTPSAL